MKVYEDNKRMLVITGVPGRHSISRNPKTGPMAQCWVLPRQLPPVEPKGMELSCGDCPLSPHNNGGCYVVLARAPLAVWKRYHALDVEPPPPRFPLGLRITAFGDPAFLPLELWEDLISRAEFYTGYTHQWKSLDASAWGRFLMASVESVEDARKARSQGWRTFRIMASNQARLDEGEVLCRNVVKSVTCSACRLCDGTHVSVAIGVHGARASRVQLDRRDT